MNIIFSISPSFFQSLRGLANILSMMRTNCLTLSNPNVSVEVKADGEALLEVRNKLQTHSFLHRQTYIVLISLSSVLLGQKLFTATKTILSPGPLGSSDDVSGVLSTVEKAIKLIGPQLKNNRTKLKTTETGNSVHELSCDLHTIKKISMTDEAHILNS